MTSSKLGFGPDRQLTPLALGLGGVLALVLTFSAIHAHSLSGDGAYHLLAGHQALRYGQNTVNLEHPPLVKLLFAVPQLLEAEPLAPPLRVDEALAAADAMHLRPDLLRRATIRARYVGALAFGLPLLVASWLLGRRFGGRGAGWVLALTLALAFSVFPNFTILQTDTAVALAFVLTTLAGMSFIKNPGFGAAALIGLAAGLGLASKFSAVLLGPAILASLLLAPNLRHDWRRRTAQALVIATAAWAIVDLSYFAANRAYTSEVGREVIVGYTEGRGTLVVGDHLKRQQDLLLAVEQIDPFLAQWLTGLLGHRAQDRVAPYPSYAFGEVYSRGRWWYLPSLLALKIPLVLLALGLVLLLRGRPRLAGVGPWVVPALVVAVYLAAYLGTSYNLGVRHLLPILPMVLLPVALAAARKPAVALLLLAALGIESVLLAPSWTSATNTWWLGRHNPTRLALGAGNTEYRLNFVQLARFAERHGIADLAVLHPAAPPVVIHAYLPGARVLPPGGRPEPGWYAVNTMFEQYLPALLRAPRGAVYDQDALVGLARSWEPTWKAIQRGEDHGYVAGSFHLYRLPPGEDPSPRGPSGTRGRR